ncbi:hypothetical protein MVEN_00168800 [Mycena venus]|uniref:glutathione transferase n=1 Tax=Mycena venus TaxID=2733690 RepID=A0A8H7DD20_9AGAR|nr:hypothetical protein MVEN_00168800 [Mycena venus]
MVLKFYADPRLHAGGGNAIVALVLAENQIPFEHISVSVAAKEHKTAEYLAIHPFGKVPAIDDDGFILYESRAICRHMAENYADQGPPLLPKRLQERAVFEQAASVEFANFRLHFQKITYETFGKPRRGLPTDQTVFDTAVAALSTTPDVYEVILGEHRFLAGDEFTVADLFHLMHAHVSARLAQDARGGNQGNCGLDEGDHKLS